MDSQLLFGGYCAHLTVPTSSQRIWIYLAEARNFLVRGLSSKLIETIIFRLEDLLLPGWVKLSTSSQRMQFLLGKFQLSGRINDLYRAEPGSYLLESLSSTVVETNIFWPQDSMLPGWEKLSTSGRRMQFLLGHIQLSGRRIEINLADSGSCLLE